LGIIIVAAAGIYFSLLYRYIKHRKHSIVEQIFKNSIYASVANKFARGFAVAVDGMLVGKFWGMEYLASYGLGYPLTIIYALPGSTLSGGTRSLYNRLFGEGKVKEAISVFNLGLWLSIISSVTLSILTYIFVSKLAVILGADGKNASLLPPLCDYLLGFACGVVFENVSKYIVGFLSLDGNAKLVVKGVMVYIITNIIGDIIVITQLDANMFVLGLTISFSRFCFMLVIASHFFRKERILRLSFAGITDNIKQNIFIIFKNSIPPTVARLSSSARGILLNKIISAATTSHFLAAFSVHTSLSVFIAPIYMGVSDTVWNLASFYNGEKNKRMLSELQKVIVYIGFSVAVFVAMILFAFAPLVAGLYMDKGDAQTHALITEAVEFFAITVPLYLLSFAYAYYIMDVGRLRMANIHLAMGNCGFVVPVAWVMVEIFGGRGAWIAEPVSVTLLLACAFVYVMSQKGDTLRDKRLLLSDDFAANTIHEINVRVDSVEGVNETIKSAKVFCLERDIDKNKANEIARCIEEVCGNIMKYGFADGKKHAVEIRVIANDEGVTLRFSDDCPLFDAVKYYNERNLKETEKDSGLNLVFKLAKDVEYVSIMKTNHLIVRM